MKKILIIDDEHGIRKAIRRFLTIKGEYEIKETDGHEASEKIKVFLPDLVILDIKMPGKSGYEILEELQQDKNTRHTKIIAISGISGGIGAAFMEVLKADAYFEKPFDNHALKKKVDELLDEGESG